MHKQEHVQLFFILFTISILTVNGCLYSALAMFAHHFETIYWVNGLNWNNTFIFPQLSVWATVYHWIKNTHAPCPSSPLLVSLPYIYWKNYWMNVLAERLSCEGGNDTLSVIHSPNVLAETLAFIARWGAVHACDSFYERQFKPPSLLLRRDMKSQSWKEYFQLLYFTSTRSVNKPSVHNSVDQSYSNISVCKE